MKKADKRKMCAGCRSEDYWYGLGGATQCWNFEGSKVVTRTRVGTWDQPPYEWRPQKVLDCFNRTGDHFLRPEDVRIVKPKKGGTKCQAS